HPGLAMGSSRRPSQRRPIDRRRAGSPDHSAATRKDPWPAWSRTLRFRQIRSGVEAVRRHHFGRRMSGLSDPGRVRAPGLMRSKIWLLVLSAAVLAAQPPRVARAMLDRWMQELSNWGRWGKTDQLGAVNLITAAKRKSAAALVKEGFTVSLSSEAET